MEPRASLPEQAWARLRQLRDTGPSGWEVPDRAWLAGWLAELAECLAALQAARTSEAARAAAAHPGDARSLFEAGWELIDVGLAAWAVGPLALADATAPGQAEVVYELAVALEAAYRPDEAVRLLDANVDLVAADPELRYQLAQATAMCGDMERLRALVPGVPADGATAGLREVLDGLVARFDALSSACRLDDTDLRGWHAVLTGGLLLVRAPGEAEGMSGRFAWTWESAEQLATVLDRLDMALAVAWMRKPTHVLADGGRDDLVLAHTAAARYRVPVVPLDADRPQGLGLLAVWSWEMTPQRLALLTGAGSDQVLGFGYWLEWTRASWPAPDVVGVLAQHAQPPWGEGIRLASWPAAPGGPEPTRPPETVTVPADDREAAVLAAELAAVPVPPGQDEEHQDAAELALVTYSLQAAARHVGVLGGRRGDYVPMGPVRSAMFT